MTNTRNGVSSSLNSDIVYVTVTNTTLPPTISTQPTNKSVPVDAIISLSVTASSRDSVLSYQWYSSTTNSTSGATAIFSAISSSYSAPTTTAGTKYYYVVITNTKNGTSAAVTSSIVSVTVTAVTAAQPIISAQPTSKSVSVGGTANLNVTAYSPDSGMLSYQWYSNTTSNTSGATAISGATSSLYSTPIMTIGMKYYYVIITNMKNGISLTVTSSIVCVTVSNMTVAIPEITVQPENTNLAVGVTAGIRVTATSLDGGVLSYQWYTNTADIISGATVISGATLYYHYPPVDTVGT
jgi:hypothetical protein